jgi:hypothetical protein
VVVLVVVTALVVVEVLVVIALQPGHRAVEQVLNHR